MMQEVIHELGHLSFVKCFGLFRVCFLALSNEVSLLVSRLSDFKSKRQHLVCDRPVAYC